MQNLDFQSGDLNELTQNVVNIGVNLVRKLNHLSNIDGVRKLQRKITQELKFLEKAQSKKTLKVNQLMCTNLIHYEYFVDVLRNQKDVMQVDSVFPMEGKDKPLRVDIVSENGARWIKVIARNSRSLNDAVMGRASYGAKSIIDQAKEYIQAASEHPWMYQPPKVVFFFRHDIDEDTAKILKEMGIEITTSLVDTPNSSSASSPQDIGILNIDVSTMIAFVSALANGSSNWKFEEEILTDQARAERAFPVKCVLENLFQGKRLICCETAANCFREIISLLGGPNEKERANEILRIIEIHPDVIEVPLELKALKLGGKIKERSLKIFAFGFIMKAVTVTSNEGFIRSAKMQGINIASHIHQARALTEQKEKTAIPLDSNQLDGS